MGLPPGSDEDKIRMCLRPDVQRLDAVATHGRIALLQRPHQMVSERPMPRRPVQHPVVDQVRVRCWATAVSIAAGYTSSRLR